MVEELICAGLQCIAQGAGKVLEAILYLGQGFSFGPSNTDKKDSDTFSQDRHQEKEE